MNTRPIVAYVTCAILAGCTAAPPPREQQPVPESPAPPSEQRKWPYEVPAGVAEADAAECGRQAEDAAFAAVSKMGPAPAIFFGVLGATAQLAWAKRRMNLTYEKAMKTCLRERGYET